MTWWINPRTRNAFKVERVVSDSTVALVNWCGLVFEQPFDRLLANGYQTVPRRPDWAEDGHYGLQDTGLYK